MVRLRSVLLASLVLGCAGPSQAARADRAAVRSPAKKATRTLGPEDVLRLRDVRDVALSPDGKSIVYVVRIPRPIEDGPGKPRSELWLVARKRGTPRRLSRDDESAWGPAWSPDGGSIAFVSRVEGKPAQIHRLQIAGGAATPVTKGEASVSMFRWSPDGTRIAYLAKRAPTPSEEDDVEKGRDWMEGDVHGTHDRLWSIDVKSGLGRPVTDRKLHVQRFAWAPDGLSFAIVASERADADAEMMYSDVLVVPATGGAAMARANHRGKLADLSWSPVGDAVAFLGGVDIHDPTAGVVHVLPKAGGATRMLTAAYEGTGQWIRWVAKDRILMLADQGTATAILSVDPAGSEPKVLRAGGPVCANVDVDAAATTLACSGATASHPREVFAGPLAKGKLERLTTVNPWLEHKRLGAQSVVTWKAADGLEVQGVLTKPVGYQSKTRYPLAILVHGGPEGISSDGWNTRSGYPAQLFATRGYVVLEPNYRGSRGRGVAYGKADQRDLGGKEFEDVLAGIDHLDRQGLIDRDRVGMGGWSYGGYFSGLAATKYSEHFKAAMVGAAITDWISFTGTTEIEHENSLVHWNLWPWDNHELAWDRSPVAHAAGSKTPTLIVHGSDDTRVPPGQAKELYRALRHFGVTTELVLYPREGHGLHEPAHELDFQNRWLDWFDQHVKGTKPQSD